MPSPTGRCHVAGNALSERKSNVAFLRKEERGRSPLRGKRTDVRRLRFRQFDSATSRRFSPRVPASRSREERANTFAKKERKILPVNYVCMVFPCDADLSALVSFLASSMIFCRRTSILSKGEREHVIRMRLLRVSFFSPT